MSHFMKFEDLVKTSQPFVDSANIYTAHCSFTIGAGEVIKGWDIGVKGMRVGGRRKLTIPAKLGYGKRGSPPEIPGDATLCFDIKLLAVK